MLLEFCLVKELCVQNTWFKREEELKVAIRLDESEKKMD